MFYERSGWRFGCRAAGGPPGPGGREGGEGGEGRGGEQRRRREGMWRRRRWFTLEGKVNSSCCFKSLGKPRLQRERAGSGSLIGM